MAQALARGVLRLTQPVYAAAFAAVAGKKEGEGPMGQCFDRVEPDSHFGQESWEQAESRMQQETIYRAMEKAGAQPEQIDLILAGDLINQCTSSTYSLRPFAIPFLGLFGACSTMAEGIVTGSLLLEAGAGNRAVAATSSHFSTAERQFRYPLSYGGQRPPTAQWTCTASGAVVLDKETTDAPRIQGVCIGKITDLGVCDANNMGAAMAPAAADTLTRWFRGTGTPPEAYDAIVTGDLGEIGGKLLLDLMMKQGYEIHSRYHDCGVLMFDGDRQDTHAGGSGCGCGGSLLCGHFLPKMQSGGIRRMLFLATGALMSPMLVQQGESIPGIAHLVEFVCGEE
ncbi:MAG: stage V sporulation protein AD [Ruminococcus sp.]|nr:stage V sporulation protein AD [Ruminococcus sp.]